MNHSNAIYRDQARTGSPGAMSTLARQFGGQRCCQPTIDHHKLPAAHPTSHARRNLTGATKRSGPFIRLGWSASLREINELRRVGLSGADARAASFNLQCTEQPAVQAFADLVPRIHSSSSSVRRRLDSHDANENGLTHAQTSFAPGANLDD